MNSKPKLVTPAHQTSTSRKWDSDSTKRHKYILRRTLKRNPTFHGLEDEDIKYLWAAYKKGVFSKVFKEELSAKEFSEIAINYILSVYTHAWVLGEKPIGIVFGIYIGHFVYLSIDWFPWATDRQMIEHAVGFLNKIRKDYYCVWDCEEKDKKFYEYIARHGIIRRVGTLHGLNHAKLWEVR